MGRMKDLDERLTGLETWHGAHAEAIKSIVRQLDQQLHLMKDMVGLEDKIKKLEEKIDGNLTKLTGQLIQMSMVQKGDSTAAVQYRAQTRLDNAFSSKESWEQGQEDEDEWPPKNSDVVGMNG